MIFLSKFKKICAILCVAAILSGPIPARAEYIYNEANHDYYGYNGYYSHYHDYPTESHVPQHIPLHHGSAIQALDMSTIHIPVVPSPATSVFFVGIPTDPGQQIFTIVASSPITSVERMLLYDNRLVLDIINSTTNLTGALPVPPGLSVTGIRASQFTDMISRVVFDLEGGTEFSIDISNDRTAVFVTIHQHVLHGVSFESGDGYDTIVLDGVRPSALRAQPGSDFLRFYLSNTQVMQGIDTPVDGMFANHLTLTGWYLQVTVPPFIVHSIWQSGPSETSIRLHPATYRNVYYCYLYRTLRIPRIDGFVMHSDYVQRFDLYHTRQFVLWLPINAMDHIGFGDMLIADPLLRTISIIHHGDFGTHLVFNGNQIFTLDLQEEEEYYVIRVMHPREWYSRIVILDPGHGGRDPGAVRSGVRESDLNLAVTRKVLQLIENDGLIRAYTTRNSDVHLHDVPAVDLRMRPELGNHIGDMFVSIHFNASTNTNANGIETYYRPSTIDDFRLLSSRRLADIMHRHKLNNLGSNDRHVRDANFAVLRYSTIPAVLLEIGFMSNPAEFARIQTTEFQWQAAWAIYQGILEAFLWVPER